MDESSGFRTHAHGPAGLTDPTRPAFGRTDPGRAVPRDGDVDPSAPAAEHAPDAATPGAAWRRWLSGSTSREVLARIVHGDPLRVREHVGQAVRRGAWLLDADRVHVRALACVARHASSYRGRPDLEPWLDRMVDLAITSILTEDEALEHDAHQPRPAEDASRLDPTSDALPAHSPFLTFAKPLGLEPESMGRACRAFNRLPEAERRTFFALVIHGRSLDDLARESGESATDIARRARRALDAILGAQSAAPATRKPESALPNATRPRALETRRTRTRGAGSTSTETEAREGDA